MVWLFPLSIINNVFALLGMAGCVPALPSLSLWVDSLLCGAECSAACAS
jgi:hypothetical protein